MELRRTAVVKLAVPDDRKSDLKRTMNTFRDAAQRFADRGWDGDDDGYVITSRSYLQHLVYDEIRADTDLHSDLCVGAANHAADALSTCVEKMKDGERTSKPEFTSNTTVYNTNAISYFDGYCSLASYGGRVHAEYVYPDDSIQAEYMDGDEWTKQGAKLRYDHASLDNPNSNILDQIMPSSIRSEEYVADALALPRSSNTSFSKTRISCHSGSE